MGKPTALVILLVGIFVVIPVLITLAILGCNHIFSAAGFAAYYGSIVVAGVVDAFTIPTVWGVLADD